MHLLLLLAALLGSLTAATQQLTFPAFDARARAAGGTGLTETAAAALFTNPAGLGIAGERPAAATATAERRFGLAELTVAGAAAYLRSGRGGFGLQLVTSGWPGYQQSRFGLAYGRALGPGFSLGVELVGFRETVEGYGGSFAATAGLGFRLAVSEAVTLGARLFSPLRVRRYPGENLPQLLAVGLRYRVGELVGLRAEAHQSARHPLRVRLGLDYRPVPELELLLGVVTAAAELSFGCVYRVLPDLRLAVAGTYHAELGVSPVFGLHWR